MGILEWENSWKRGSTERGTNCGYNELYHIVSVSKSSQKEEHRANLNPTTMIRASPTSARSRSTRWKVAAARSFGQTSSPGGGRLQPSPTQKPIRVQNCPIFPTDGDRFAGTNGSTVGSFETRSL